MLFQNNFGKNNNTKIVPKKTTFTYSKKTPEEIVEEREMKRTNALFNEINKDRKSTRIINNNFFKNRLK